MNWQNLDAIYCLINDGCTKNHWFFSGFEFWYNGMCKMQKARLMCRSCANHLAHTFVSCKKAFYTPLSHLTEHVRYTWEKTTEFSVVLIQTQLSILLDIIEMFTWINMISPMCHIGPSVWNSSPQSKLILFWS